ncbi:hydroxypyruvate isomerase [Oleiphilus sp. HI0125]|uniref:hydroxypyruvate isomerase n=1 Tax=Oleiphilus sp. HI0125 TaxID=1822266 RepID=UPI0007C34FE8|nr:hydroxypyruvate isomerase [Oleiphilus sp. HI0125]KZZ57776.1 hydroxypyruvate isomerase [Oleiphilus sp. HI0125]
MPKFAANITMLFQEHDFLDRFKAAKDNGFRYIEYLFPYDYSAQDLVSRLQDNNLEQVLFNLPPGDWSKGERGIACLPDRKDEFRRGIDQAIHYAEQLNVKQLNCLSGLKPNDLSEEEAESCWLENIHYAASALESAGIKLLVEAINSKVDMPGFYLDTLEKSQSLIDQVQHTNVYFQFDLYHMQIMHGDLERSLKSIWPHIQHVQFADSPGRHEPGTGDIDFEKAFNFLDQNEYTGFVSAEYLPKTDTVSSLAWLRSFN